MNYKAPTELPLWPLVIITVIAVAVLYLVKKRAIRPHQVRGALLGDAVRVELLQIDSSARLVRVAQGEYSYLVYDSVHGVATLDKQPLNQSEFDQ